MRKRIGSWSAKARQIRAGWGRSDSHETPSVIYAWGGDGARKGDAMIVAGFFERVRDESGMTLLRRLEENGYDLSTLKFTVDLKGKDDDAV